MPRQERLTAEEAEKRLLTAGFSLVRTKGSHRIYRRDNDRITIPFHRKLVLHPKIVAHVLSLTERRSEGE
ncbi:MAG: addiction module toxin, HicA family [Spirochaetes bacterium]|nr:addiction module toxin, HicA family [Spirochaetota bacterium]